MIRPFATRSTSQETAQTARHLTPAPWSNRVVDSEVGPSRTAKMIEAVLVDEPTPGMPERLGGGGTGPVGPNARSGFGALVATTAGKILLSTAVAAASVGGVYATTERIERPGASDPPAVENITAIDGDVETEALIEQADPTVRSDAKDPNPAPEGHESPDVGVPTDTGLEGCERGQAIADAASSSAAEHQQGTGPPVDPCTRRDERGPGDPPDLDRDADATDEPPDGRRKNPPAAPGGPGRPNGRGNGE